MQKIIFRKAGQSEDGDALYNLWIEGVLIQENLTIDEVVERIAGADPDRSPPRTRTPEDLRGEMQTR
jgi:hypothetical protein